MFTVATVGKVCCRVFNTTDWAYCRFWLFTSLKSEFQWLGLAQALDILVVPVSSLQVRISMKMFGLY